MRGHSILRSSGESRAWFCISFGITAIVACSISLLARGGVPYEIFQRLFVLEDMQGALALLGVILVGLLPPMQTAGLRLAAALGDHPVIAAAGTTAALVAGACVGYLMHPLSMDEYAAVFQSRIFAAGELCGQFPPGLIDWLIPGQFQNVFFVISRDTGCIASAYWPGFALLMTPFSYAGVPWLCNPVVSGATVFVMHRLGMRLFGDRSIAGLVTLLTIGSTAVTINGISMYSMPAHLLFNATFCLLLLREEPRFALLAGLIGGWALILHNPFPHALFAMPWLGWLAARTHRWHLLGCVAVGYAPFLAGALLWTDFLQSLKAAAHAATALESEARALPSPMVALWDSAGRIFRFPSPDVFQARAIGLAKLWLWAAPGVIALAAWGLALHRRDLRLQLFGASALATILGYFFYPEDQGHGWGFRYFHSAWLVIPLLAASVFVPGTKKTDRMALRRLVAGCALAAMVGMTILRMYQTREFISAHLAQLPPVNGGVAAVQFVNTANGYYAIDLVQNDPFLRRAPVRMISMGRRRDSAMLAQHFPELDLLAESDGGSTWGHAGETQGSLSTSRDPDHREQE